MVVIVIICTKENLNGYDVVPCALFLFLFSKGGVECAADRPRDADEETLRPVHCAPRLQRGRRSQVAVYMSVATAVVLVLQL